MLHSLTNKKPRAPTKQNISFCEERLLPRRHCISELPEQGMAANACHPSAQDTKAEGLRAAASCGQPGLQNEIVKKKKEKKKKRSGEKEEDEEGKE